MKIATLFDGKTTKWQHSWPLQTVL